MQNVVIFGNSGSGKSTLAKLLAAQRKIEHLDLDTLAWQDTSSPKRRPIAESSGEVEAFITQNSAGWVIEGCYSDLLSMCLETKPTLYYLNLPVESCVDNARNRPWEEHKYSSKAAQDKNLEMLLGWIAAYPNRDDVCSASAHQKLFSSYEGDKYELTSTSAIDRIIHQ